MTPTLIGLLMFAGMLAMMAVRVPIAAAMFIPGAIGYMALTSDTALLSMLKGSSVARMSIYDLSVIPLFLLMGQFATQGGLSRALFKAAASFIGHIRGGLAMSAVMSAAAFGAVCGSSVATSATITQVAYPEMKAHGYHGRLSTGTLAVGGTLGILIPPSVPLVVYAILTEQNIAKLFAAAMAGILPWPATCRHCHRLPPRWPSPWSRPAGPSAAAHSSACGRSSPSSSWSSAASMAAFFRPPKAQRSARLPPWWPASPRAS
jgi:TRAP-type C4-dicarboxylate transport system permease large subunit